MRSPEWEFEGFQFLAKNYPEKYMLDKKTYWEGMIFEYSLVDLKTKIVIGNTLIKNNVQNSLAFKVENSYDQS